MRGYSQVSFWISKALAKTCFCRIVKNRAKKYLKKLKALRPSQDAQNVCAVAKTSTVLNEVPPNVVTIYLGASVIPHSRIQDLYTWGSENSTLFVNHLNNTNDTKIKKS